MATKTFLCDKDYTDRFISGGASGGSGGDAHLPVGKGPDGRTYRTYLRFANNWTGVGRIISAQMHFRTAAGHGAAGATPRTVVRLLNMTMGTSEPASGENVWTDPYLHLTNYATPIAQFDSPIPLDQDVFVDVTELIELLAPATVQRRDGSPGGARVNHGWMLQGNSENLLANFVTFRSRNASNAVASRPYITLTYDGPNVGPNAPTNMQPAGSVTRAITHFTGTFTDPNPDDKLTASMIRIYDEENNQIWEQVSAAGSAEIAASAFSVPIPALVRSGIPYAWTARVQDQRGQWGAFTPINQKVSFRFLNNPPSLSGLAPSGGSFASLSHLQFRGNYSDPDSDPMGQYRIQLRVTTAPGHVDWDSDTNLWDTGDVTPTAQEVSINQPSAPYSGQPLTPATYSWRMRVMDKWGEPSAWVYATVTLTAPWNPDPGDIDFLTGYGQKPPRPRILIRGMSALRGPLGGPPLAVIEDAANIGCSRYLNAPGEVYWTMPATHPQVSVIEPYKVHYAIEVWRGDRWVEIFYGVVTDFDATDDDVVFYGTDYEGMLDKVVDSRFDLAAPKKPYTAGGSYYTDVSITTVIADQLATAKGKTNSPVGFIENYSLENFAEKVTIYSTFTPVLSFIQGLMESHQQGTGNRSRLYVRKDIEGTDYAFKWHLAHSPGVVRDNLRLEYGGLVQGFRLTAFGDFATFSHGIGKAREGILLHYATQAATGIDPAIYGRIENVRVWEDIEDNNDLQRRLKQAAAQAARVGKRVAMAIRVDSLQPFDGWDIADHIPVHIKRGVVDTTAYGSGYWTIHGVEWLVFPDGHTDLTFVVLPREDDVPPDPDLIPSVPILPGAEWEIGYQPPVQGVNVSKFYVDLTTGITYQQEPDGSFTEVDSPPTPTMPTGLALSSSIVYDQTGDPVPKLTATIVQPSGTNHRGVWVEATALNDGEDPPAPVWDESAVAVFIPNPETTGSIESVAGNTLYFARAWSVDFVGTPSAKTSEEEIVTVKDEIGPPIPTGFQVAGSLKAILAQWTPTSAADLAFYEFRYAPDDGSTTGPGGTPPWVIQRARTSFIYIGDLPENVMFWSQVRAVDRSGNVDESGVTRNYADYPDAGWTTAASATTSLVDAGLIEPGSIDPTHIAFLDAGQVVTGHLRINTSLDDMFDGISVYGDDGETELGRWDETGLYIREAGASDNYVHLNEGSVTIYFGGVPLTAMTVAGINASAITFGSMPPAENLLRNSSFEIADFGSGSVVTTTWTADADWDASKVGSDTNITENAGDRQMGAATF